MMLGRRAVLCAAGGGEGWLLPAGAAACAAFVCAVGMYVYVVRRRTAGAVALFGVCVLMFFFLFGCWRSASVWHAVRAEWPEGVRTYRAVLADVPRTRGRSVSAEVWAASSEGAAGDDVRKVSVTWLHDARSETLQAGDGIEFDAVVHRPRNRGNPEEFDYAEYLTVKGVGGQTFLTSSAWRRLSPAETAAVPLPPVAGMRLRALGWRDDLLRLYRQAGLQGDEYALLSAVTLGERSGLSRGLRRLYAEAGVSHVLALSGMHLGFLMILFNMLFVRCARRRVLQTAVALLALLSVWTYAFVAGLPASLVRASGMYSLMWGAALFGRQGFSVNALLTVVFAMLCIGPMYLYDVGFLLSVLAVAGILAVYPRGKDWRMMRARRTGWLCRSLWLSVSAQVLVLPLAAHVFGTVSLCSAVATLVISPLTALLLLSMPLLLVSGWVAPACSAFIAGVAGWSVRLQNGLLQWVAAWPLSVVEADLPLWPMLLVYALLGVLLTRRWWDTASWLKTLLAGTCLLALVWTVERRRNAVQPCIVFYNQSSCPAVHVIESAECSYLFPARAENVEERMDDIKRTFWRKKLSAPPVMVTGDYRDARVAARSGWVTTRQGVSFLLLSDDRWNLVSGRAAEVDYMLVCRGFTGDLQALSALFRPRCVVLDASLSARQRLRYKNDCRRLGWRFYDVESEGALKVALK